MTAKSAPLGATPRGGGVNFRLFSRHASEVELCLFDRVDDARPSRVVRLEAGSDRTWDYWRTFVPELRPGQLYAYRVSGPFAPERGLRFDTAKLLLDPYGRGVAVPAGYDRQAARRAGDTCATAMKSVVVDTAAYDWEGDQPLRRASAQTLVYELHVRGFTRHPSSGVAPAARGTFRGLCEKIPYLQSLGITAVELLPVFQFDAQDCPPGLVNHWGYAPVSFFAPHQAYSSRQDPLGPVDEFRDEVRRTQRGNNNAYCHDDETTWFDWTLLERHADVLRFVTMLNRRWPVRGEPRPPLSLTQLLREARCTWHGVTLGRPDWGDDSHTVAVSAEVLPAGLHLHVILSAYWEPLDFELPPRGPWRRRIDTALDSPHDIVDWTAAPVVTGARYRVEPRSLVVLFVRV